MAYTSQIRLTIAGAEMLLNQIKENRSEMSFAHAFSMTDMDVSEVLSLHNAVMSAMLPLNNAYSEIFRISKHFVENFTTENNDYFIYAKRCMSKVSVALWAYKKACFAFLPSRDWYRKKKGGRVRRDLYSNSTAGREAAVCKDLFPECYPSHVQNLLSLIKVFFDTLRNCAAKIDSTIQAVERMRSDVKALVKSLIRYRENLVYSYDSIFSMKGLTPQRVAKNRSNPLFDQGRIYRTDEERAKAWYHNCAKENLDEFLLYEHTNGISQFVAVPIPFVVENLHQFFGTKPQLTVLISELYEESGFESLKTYWSEFKKCYEQTTGKKCVGYSGVDKHKNLPGKKRKYSREIDNMNEEYFKLVAHDASMLDTSLPYPSPKPSVLLHGVR